MNILITENQLRKVQFKYLNYLFEGISEIEINGFAKYWEKNGKIVLELDYSPRLWVLDTIWDSISTMFSLDYDETQQLIKEWIEQQLEFREIIPFNVEIRRHPDWDIF